MYPQHESTRETSILLPHREMEMERLRLRDEVESLQIQLASLEGETPRAFNDDNLRHAPLWIDASPRPCCDSQSLLEWLPRFNLHGTPATTSCCRSN